MTVWLLNILKQNKGFMLFILLMFLFRSAIADWNTVPTASMKPTILEGDRILVNKTAYDLRLPFSEISLHQISDPKHGDIIIFESKAANKRLVKRVIGIPGDLVSMSNNKLYINGIGLDYTNVSSATNSNDKLENLHNRKYYIRTQKTASTLSNFNATRVPEGHYLALGDNRDNSADSRVIGFVPRNEIIGRSKHVVMSFDINNFYKPRIERLFKTL